MPGERPQRLLDQLATMVALEQSIERRVDQLSREAIEHDEVVSLLERVRKSSHDRSMALTTRLDAIASGTPALEPVTTPSVLEALYATAQYQASGALLAAHALLSQAVMGYAILLELAFRAADSVEHLGADNTGDLAWSHMQSSAAMVTEIVRMMPYVVVDELEGEGLDCNCRCPTCGLGVCGCALAFRRRMDMATAEAGPTESWPGITMARPRPGSPAATAGIEKDDVLTKIDGKVIGSIPMLQDAIKAHRSGETIELEVKRAGGAVETIAVVRP